MKITSSVKDRKLTLYLSGEMDHHSVNEIMRKIEDKIESDLPRDCIFDMTEVTFMDSSGIAVILKTYRRMRALEGRFWIENVQTQPMHVMDAAGIDRLIEISEGGICR